MRRGITPVKEHYYRSVFSTEVNLNFQVTRKDTCKTCDRNQQACSVEKDQRKKEELKTQHELHLRKAEKARASLKEDALKAQNNDSLCTLTFDLQKALSFSKLSVSEAYYRLWEMVKG